MTHSYSPSFFLLIGVVVLVVVVVNVQCSWSFQPTAVRVVGRRWLPRQMVGAQPFDSSQSPVLHAARDDASSSSTSTANAAVAASSLTLTKPLGMILEEVVENQPHGVFVKEISDKSGSAYQYRDQIIGSKLCQVNGVDVTTMSFDNVMSVLIDAPNPVALEFISSSVADSNDDTASSSSSSNEISDLPVGTPVTMTVKSSAGDAVPLQARVGDNLRQTLLNNNIEVYQGLKQKLGNCGGAGQCGFCAMDFVDASKELWLERSDYENKKLKRFPMARLSCLNSIQGPATIQKTQQ